VPRSGHFVRLDTGLQTARACWLGASPNVVLAYRFYLLVCVSQAGKIRVHRDPDWAMLSCISGAECLELITKRRGLVVPIAVIVEALMSNWALYLRLPDQNHRSELQAQVMPPCKSNIQHRL
jgi:hypothetical protein